MDNMEYVITEEDFHEEQFGIVEDRYFPWEKIREERRKQKEIPSLLWLAKEIKTIPDALGVVLRLIRKNSGYREIYLRKSNGGKRKILIPEESLKRIQRKINKHILKYIKPKQNAYGFSRGNIIEAVKPHLRSKSLLCVDFKDAFPTITSDNVLDYFTKGRVASVEHCGNNYTGFTFTTQIYECGWFSWYGARALSELVTCNGKLPQGAPTSPRLFDLMCEKIDEKLLKLAKNVNGQYTRYADNIFFSVSLEKFPRPLKQAVLKIIDGRNFHYHVIGKNKHKRPGPKFEWHKLKVRKLNNGAVRMLGLNIIKKEIHNTRAFKRRLRLAIHHANWLLDRYPKGSHQFETAWKKLQGQMQFVRKDTLPKKLLSAYAELEQRLK